MLNLKKPQPGFTLIEMLLYVTISSLILLAISGLWYMLVQSSAKQQTIDQVEQQGAFAMNLIQQTIRNSQAVNTPTQGSSAASLSLDVVTGADDPTIFDLSSGALRIKKGAAAAIAITSTKLTVSSLDFSNRSRRAGNTTIRISFTIAHVNPANRNEYAYSKTFVGSATIRDN